MGTNRLLSHNTLCRGGLGPRGLLHGEGVRVPGGLLLGGGSVLGGFEEVEEAHFCYRDMSCRRLD